MLDFLPTMLNYMVSILPVCIYAIIFFNCKRVGNTHVEDQVLIVTFTTVKIVFTCI